MSLAFAGAIISLLGWAILAFVLAVPSGWVHLPLALGCVLLARAFMGKPRS